MSYPILNPNSSWFTPTVSTIKRATITSINIVDSYTPSATPTDSWDASVAQDGSIMCYVEGTTLTIAGNGSGNIMANEDSSYMFSGMTNLTSVNCGVLDTSNTTNMEYMFGHTGAMKLTSITFGNKFDTSKVRNFLGIFRNLRSITNIDVTGFNTSSATTMERMFDRCEKLQSLDCSNFDTSKVISVALMFQVNYVLTTVGDISGWDLSNCTSTRGMFSFCQKLGNINVSNWNVSKVTDMVNMFNKCELFTELDVSKWNVSKVEGMNSMFSECKNLRALDVSKWDISSCTDMGFVFYGCQSLTELAVDNWEVSQVSIFDHLFAHCSNLVNVNTSKWNVTSAATNMNAMFHSVKHTYIDVTGWDTSNVIAFAQMFEDNSNLERIDGLNTLNTSNCHSFDQMFTDCTKIKELDLSSFDTRKADVGYPTSTNGSTSGCTQNMFNNCRSLEKITLGANFTFAGDGTAPVEAHGSLPTPSATYIDGADGNWHTEDGSVYAPADVPNLTYMVYYASPIVLAGAIWDRDSKKYMHLSAMRVYHDMLNTSLDVKLDTLREELGDVEEISSEEIQALFSVNA